MVRVWLSCYNGCVVKSDMRLMNVKDPASGSGVFFIVLIKQPTIVNV